VNREPVRAWVGLGGNLGDVETTLHEALWAIDSLPQTSIRAQSGFYRSAPWGRADQPPFINAAVELQTRLASRVLLDYLLEIEGRFGRVRRPEDKWGPRTLDLDLLAFGDEVRKEPGLELPHPQVHARAFVLVPLAEIAPDLVVDGQRIGAAAARIDRAGVERLASRPE